MLEVGDHLRVAAMAKSCVNADRFGRSVFNRFYYSAYLRTRETLKFMGSEYTMGHASIPTHLKVKIKPLFKSCARASSALSGRSEINAIASKCHVTCGEIAYRLEILNALRKTADYNPDIPSEIRDSDVILGSCKSAVARKYVAEIHMQCERLEGLWRQIES